MIFALKILFSVFVALSVFGFIYGLEYFDAMKSTFTDEDY